MKTHEIDWNSMCYLSRYPRHAIHTQNHTDVTKCYLYTLVYATTPSLLCCSGAWSRSLAFLTVIWGQDRITEYGVVGIAVWCRVVLRQGMEKPGGTDTIDCTVESQLMMLHHARWEWWIVRWLERQTCGIKLVQELTCARLLSHPHAKNIYLGQPNSLRRMAPLQVQHPTRWLVAGGGAQSRLKPGSWVKPLLLFGELGQRSNWPPRLQLAATRCRRSNLETRHLDTRAGWFLEFACGRTFSHGSAWLGIEITQHIYSMINIHEPDNCVEAASRDIVHCSGKCTRKSKTCFITHPIRT